MEDVRKTLYEYDEKLRMFSESLGAGLGIKIESVFGAELYDENFIDLKLNNVVHFLFTMIGNDGDIINRYRFLHRVPVGSLDSKKLIEIFNDNMMEVFRGTVLCKTNRNSIEVGSSKRIECTSIEDIKKKYSKQDK